MDDAKSLICVYDMAETTPIRICLEEHKIDFEFIRTPESAKEQEVMLCNTSIVASSSDTELRDLFDQEGVFAAYIFTEDMLTEV
jgi:hypothetical protein